MGCLPTRRLLCMLVMLFEECTDAHRLQKSLLCERVDNLISRLSRRLAGVRTRDDARHERIIGDVGLPVACERFFSTLSERCQFAIAPHRWVKR